MIKCWKICHGDRGSQNDTTFPPIPDQALPLRQRRLRYSMGSVVDSGQYLGGVERPCAGLRRAAGASTTVVLMKLRDVCSANIWRSLDANGARRTKPECAQRVAA